MRGLLCTLYIALVAAVDKLCVANPLSVEATPSSCPSTAKVERPQPSSGNSLLQLNQLRERQTVHDEDHSEVNKLDKTLSHKGQDSGSSENSGAEGKAKDKKEKLVNKNGQKKGDGGGETKKDNDDEEDVSKKDEQDDKEAVGKHDKGKGESSKKSTAANDASTEGSSEKKSSGAALKTAVEHKPKPENRVCAGWKSYVTSGGDACPAADAIGDAGVCEAALKLLKYGSKFGGSTESSSRPMGCFYVESEQTGKFNLKSVSALERDYEAMLQDAEDDVHSVCARCLIEESDDEAKNEDAGDDATQKEDSKDSNEKKNAKVSKEKKKAEALKDRGQTEASNDGKKAEGASDETDTDDSNEVAVKTEASDDGKKSKDSKEADASGDEKKSKDSGEVAAKTEATGDEEKSEDSNEVAAKTEATMVTYIDAGQD